MSGNGQNDIGNIWSVIIANGEEGRGQCGIEGAGVDVIDEITKVKNDLLIGFP